MPTDDRTRWNTRYAEQVKHTDPSPFVLGLDSVLPKTGRAIDVAGGAGRHALWLAARGLDVTLADVSDVALAKAKAEAAERNLPLTTLQADLEGGPFPPGPWDLILCTFFLYRPIFASFERELAPGGILVFAHATKKNLERHQRPGADHVLDDGELPSLVRGLEVLTCEEGWLEGGRHEARVVARKRVG